MMMMLVIHYHIQPHVGCVCCLLGCTCLTAWVGGAASPLPLGAASPLPLVDASHGCVPGVCGAFPLPPQRRQQRGFPLSPFLLLVVRASRVLNCMRVPKNNNVKIKGMSVKIKGMSNTNRGSVMMGQVVMWVRWQWLGKITVGLHDTSNTCWVV